MSSLLELVTSMLGDGDTFEKLGEIIGGDTKQASAAAGLAAPVILGGLADHTQQDSGLETVMGMLDANSSVLGDLGGFLERGETEAGNSILDSLFGGGRADLVSGLAAKADIAGPIVGKLLPLLAPIVATVVGNERTLQELDGPGVATMLADEKVAMEGEGVAFGLADFPPSSNGNGTHDHDGGKDADTGDDGDVSDEVDSNGAGKAAGAAAVGAAGAAVAAGAKAKDAAADKVGDLGDAAGDVADKARDAVSTAADKAGDVADKAGDAAEAVADKAGDAAGAVGDKLGDAKAAMTSGVKGIVGDDDNGDRSGGLSWLWWALGAVALVLLLAWLLSQCNDDDNDVDAGSDTTAVAVSDDDDSDGDSDDGDDDDDAGDDDDAAMADDDEAMADDDDDADPTGSGGDADADLQAAVDDALSGSGATGAVVNGVVTLTGTVDSDDASSDAEDAITALDGVESVTNELKVEPEDDADEDVETGDTINELLDLDPVTFRVSSATITTQGEAVLDDAAAFMEANPAIDIEIGGHTDNDGGEAENLDLSQRRADSVKAYLTASGVDADRMETKGYGESEPKVANNSAAAKAENRRIEFTVQ